VTGGAGWTTGGAATGGAATGGAATGGACWAAGGGVWLAVGAGWATVGAVWVIGGAVVGGTAGGALPWARVPPPMAPTAPKGPYPTFVATGVAGLTRACSAAA